MICLGAIGLGRRGGYLVRTLMELNADVRLAAVADPDRAGVLRFLKDRGIDEKQVRIYDDADSLLANADELDALLVSTRCHLHAPMAVKAAVAKLPLYLEKPVAISMEQAIELHGAYAGREESVVVSFPLRVTPLFVAASQIVESGRLGTINQVQAVNNVPYGGTYYGNWYRNYDQTGGLWLQKATHDFDAITRILGRRPIAVAATANQKIYGGDMPFDLRCSKCDRTADCMESPQNMALRNDSGGMMEMPVSRDSDHACAFSDGIGNQDSGCAIVLYDDGTHALYAQNFIARRGAAIRGMTIIGYKATLQFDWYTDTITVHDHHVDRVDRIKVLPSGGHSGGDAVLLDNFVQVIRGEKPSVSTLADGLLSITMCLAARQSAQTRQFQTICLPWETAGVEAFPVQFVGG